MTKEHTLVTFWKEQIENADDINLNESALSLQRQAEITVSDYKNKWLEAQTSLRKIKIASKDIPNFEAIIEAEIAIQVTEKQFNIALTSYTNMFGESPKLLDFTPVVDIVTSE